jgi:hypothetical protein
MDARMKALQMGMLQPQPNLPPAGPQMPPVGGAMQ